MGNIINIFRKRTELNDNTNYLPESELGIEKLPIGMVNSLGETVYPNSGGNYKNINKRKRERKKTHKKLRNLKQKKRTNKRVRKSKNPKTYK